MESPIPNLREWPGRDRQDDDQGSSDFDDPVTPPTCRIRFRPQYEAVLPRANPEQTTDVPRRGRQEDYVVVAHSPYHQALFEKYNISWGVQYQVAALVSTKKILWEAVTEDRIRELQGTNAEAAPKVSPLFFGSNSPEELQMPTFGRSPWIELDDEEKSGTNVCLGLVSPTFRSTEDILGPWWGGRVVQRVVLVKNSPERRRQTSQQNGLLLNRGSPLYTIQLSQATAHATSFHLARALGSRRFIIMKLPGTEDMRDDDRIRIRHILQKGLLICGRVFRAFLLKDNSIRFIETTENVDRVPDTRMGDGRRKSFPDFVRWFNPLNRNPSQLVCKWSSRFSLGMSTSIPGCIFGIDNIEFIPDIVSSAHTRLEDTPESKLVMSDGCGRINRAALRIIQQRLGLPALPTAVQARIAGSKGLWIVDTEDLSEQPRIWITTSQVKIRYLLDELRDPSRRMLDVLRISEVKSSIRLNKQAIINLHHNGVPTSAFCELLQEGLKDFFGEIFAEWDTNATLRLWEMIFYQNGVGKMRQRRYSQAVLKTFGQWDNEKPEDGRDNGETRRTQDQKVDLGPDPYSGWPSDFAEQAVELIQAGFHPRTFPLLGAKVKTALKTELKAMTNDICIHVKRSAMAFAVPDFRGLLEEGEVFFKSSDSRCGLIDHPSMADGVARGPVVIWRDPCRLPSDARRMAAVDCPALYGQTDVLILSTKGGRSGMSILAGGDYDGDVVHMTTEPRIIDHFINSSLEFADPPPGFDSDIDQYSVPAKILWDRISKLSPFEQAEELQGTIISPIVRENFTGKYSKIADHCLYTRGYAHPSTIHATYAYFNELDAAKTGRSIRGSVYKRDAVERRKYRLPTSLLKPKDRETAQDWKNLACRPDQLEPFILDILLPLARTEQKRYEGIIDDLPVEQQHDADLLKPLELAIGRAEAGTRMGDELERLQAFVGDEHQSWTDWWRSEQWRSNTASENQHVVRRISEDFHLCRKLNIESLKYFSKEEACIVMASAAYKKTLGKNSSEFAFVVGHKYLALAKAQASDWVVMSRTFSDYLSPSRAAITETLSRPQQIYRPL